MKYIVPVVAIATVLTLGAWTPLSAEEENEQTVKMSDLPAAVQTTIKDKAGTNEIEKIEKKTEEGKTIYEAVVNKKGKEWSIEVDANGKLLKQYEESKEKEQGEKGEKYEARDGDVCWSLRQRFAPSHLGLETNSSYSIV